MTIEQAIRTADMLKPNKFDEDLKVMWLSNFDMQVADEVIRKHEDTKDFHFSGYNEATDREKELLIPAPYDELYVPYLQSKMDLYNQDYERYNSSTAAYYVIYSNYMAYYNREHLPICTSIKVI